PRARSRSSSRSATPGGVSRAGPERCKSSPSTRAQASKRPAFVAGAADERASSETSAITAGKTGLLLAWDRVLGLDLHRSGPERDMPPGVAELLAERERARVAKDFARSDQLRAQLASLGVDVIETTAGQRIKR